MRTTDARQAITALLESSDPSTVIQYDGTTYRVALSGDKREGFFTILSKEQAKSIQDSHDGDKGALAEVLDRDCELWFRSARYQASLAALSD